MITDRMEKNMTVLQRLVEAKMDHIIQFKHKYNMNPLAVTIRPIMETELGIKI